MATFRQCRRYGLYIHFMVRKCALVCYCWRWALVPNAHTCMIAISLQFLPLFYAPDLHNAIVRVIKILLPCGGWCVLCVLSHLVTLIDLHAIDKQFKDEK